MDVALQAEHISKIYQLGEIGTGTISRDIERWYARMRGKEDPFLKIGEANLRDTAGGNVVWSLKDVSFEIPRGAATAVIGRNGAGKSTLLKVMSRITAPTLGTIRGNGRVASLLEVGTGFNPELTGRENIYLNGAILGMRKSEIRRHFDAIVDFSGVERYIDTPVKRYSSGMYVRLAFAVAAHLEAEILLIDEVLAVGDAEFQKKCLGKMNEMSRGEGRTVLFVSHNMDAVINLCSTGIVLENGSIAYSGDVGGCVEHYQKLSHVAIKSSWERRDAAIGPKFRNMELSLGGAQPNLELKITFTVASEGRHPSAFVAFGVKNALGGTIMEAIPSLSPFVTFDGAQHTYSLVIKLDGFIPNVYSVYAWMGPSEAESYDWIDDAMSFEIAQPPMKDRTFPYHYRSGFLVAESTLLPGPK